MKRIVKIFDDDKSVTCPEIQNQSVYVGLRTTSLPSRTTEHEKYCTIYIGNVGGAVVQRVERWTCDR